MIDFLFYLASLLIVFYCGYKYGNLVKVNAQATLEATIGKVHNLISAKQNLMSQLPTAIETEDIAKLDALIHDGLDEVAMLKSSELKKFQTLVANTKAKIGAEAKTIVAEVKTKV